MVSRKKIAIIGSLILAAFIIFVLVIYLALASALSGIHPVQRINGSIAVYAGITTKGIATYNMSDQLVEYAQMDYHMYNVTSANIVLTTFAKNPIFRIYLVNSSVSCYKCVDYRQLYANLSTDLGMYGLLRNYTSLENVSLDDINSTRNGSVIILATGLFPASLLPDTGLPLTPGVSNITLLNLLARGDYVIYAGTGFSQMIQSGNIYLTPNATLSALAGAGLETYPHTNVTKSSLFFNTPTFNFLKGKRYGAVSYTNTSLNWTVIAFSNYPDVIWSNSSDAANDLARVVSSRFWMQRIALGTYNITGDSKSLQGNATLLTTDLLINNSAAAAEEINSSYSLIHVNASNAVSWQDAEFPFTVSFSSNGTIGVPSDIGYGTQVPLQIKVSSQSSSKSFSIEVVNRSLEYTYSFPLSFFNTSLPTVKYYSFGDLPTGQYYIASLVDINGRHYGNALFFVPFLNVTAGAWNFKNGTFLFGVLSNGQVISGVPFSATINGEYNESGIITNGGINYTLPKGAILSYGDYNVSVHILNKNYVISELYAAPPGIPSLYIEFGIAAAVILLLNIVLRAPNREEYFIDISENPPTQKKDVTLTSDQIVNLFDTINYHRYWKYMPLTPEEVKSGISTNIRVDNTPVSVTLQNINEVLSRLSSEGKLSYMEEYYMPKRWESVSKHDTEYLTIFRQLRDYLVKHAILFTDLDQSKDADMVLTSKGKQVPVFIFSRGSGVRKIKISEQRKAFVVFINSEARYQFSDRLYGTYGKTSETLRLAIESGSITLIDTSNLDALLY